MAAKKPKMSRQETSFQQFGDSRTKEVTELRKSGKLKEAYELAKNLLDESPDDEFVKSAYGWCLYALAKEAKDGNDAKKLDKILTEMKSMDFGDNVILKDCIARLDVNSERNVLLSKLKAIDIQKLKGNDELVKEMENLAWSFFKISEPRAHAIDVAILQQVSAGLSNVSSFDYIDFVKRWDVSNFTADDEKEFISASGNRVEPIVLRVLRRLGRRAGDYELTEDEKEFVLGTLDKYLATFNDPVLYQSKAGLVTDNNPKEALALYKRALKLAADDQKPSILFDLAYMFIDENNELALACFGESMSLSQTMNEVRRRRALAELLIKMGKFPEAKYEIEKLRDRAVKLGYQVNKNFEGAWINSDWYDKTKPTNNARLYATWGAGTDVLFENEPTFTAKTSAAQTDKDDVSYEPVKEQAPTIQSKGSKKPTDDKYEVDEDDTIPF